MIYYQLYIFLWRKHRIYRKINEVNKKIKFFIACKYYLFPAQAESDFLFSNEIFDITCSLCHPSRSYSTNSLVHDRVIGKRNIKQQTNWNLKIRANGSVRRLDFTEGWVAFKVRTLYYVRILLFALLTTMFTQFYA